MPLDFKPPHVIRATYRIVTPMFIGDAEQKASGISPTSVKGALRFWWRALNWGRVWENNGRDDSSALQALHEEEAALFGTSADKGKAAQFTLRVIPQHWSVTKVKATHKDFSKYTASRYLGYGLMEAFNSKNKGTEAGQLVRDCLNEEQTFSVEIKTHVQIQESLKQALIALGLLGGLGSRVRHGMGSISLITLLEDDVEIWSEPTHETDYVTAVRNVLGKTSYTNWPPFTSFSSQSRIDVLGIHTTPYAALDAFGKEMLLYRSWGNNGKVLGQEREGRFREDHDWSKGIRPNGFHPKRVVFGLPHNYGQGNNLAVTPSEHERRASPLFFHIHCMGKQFLGVTLLLPADFLPEGEHINAGGTNYSTPHISDHCLR